VLPPAFADNKTLNIPNANPKYDRKAHTSFIKILSRKKRVLIILFCEKQRFGNRETAASSGCGV
jgi:hypothetical protein